MVYKTLLMNYCQIIFCKKRSKNWSCQPHTYYQQGGQGGLASRGSQWLPPGVFNSHQQKQDWHHLCKYWLQYLDFHFYRRLHLISLEILSLPLHDNHLFSSSVFPIQMKSCPPIISITTFWSFVLDDHWSKTIYTPKMIVWSGAILHP